MPVNMTAVIGVFVVAAAATIGDAIWYTYGVRHTMIAGLVHGALLLTAVGAVLGAASGRLVKGLPLGALAGIGGAASYYVLVALVDGRPYGSAIPGSWVIMWLLLGFMVHHVYSSLLMDAEEKNGLMTSIFSGYKFVRRRA